MGILHVTDIGHMNEVGTSAGTELESGAVIINNAVQVGMVNIANTDNFILYYELIQYVTS